MPNGASGILENGQDVVFMFKCLYNTHCWKKTSTVTLQKTITVFATIMMFLFSRLLKSYKKKGIYDFPLPLEMSMILLHSLECLRSRQP